MKRTIYAVLGGGLLSAYIAMGWGPLSAISADEVGAVRGGVCCGSNAFKNCFEFGNPVSCYTVTEQCEGSGSKTCWTREEPSCTETQDPDCENVVPFRECGYTNPF